MRIQVDKDELMELKKNGVAKTKAKSKNAPLFKDSDNIRAEDENQDLYNKCMLYWESLSGFRKRMKRNRKYYRGDQWHELIQDPESGDMITEETFIRNQGRIPFKQNMIRQMVNNMLGQYRANTTKPLVVAVNSKDSAINDMMNNAIRGVHNLNDIDSLDTRNFESFLLSGAAIGKVTTTYFPEKDRKDIFYQNVNPSRIFFNPDVEDIRLNDLHTIGEIVDTTIDSVITSFAKNKKQEQEIRDHYQSMDGQNGIINQGLDSSRIDNISFSGVTDTETCRVVIVWQKKSAWKTLVHDYMDGSWEITDLSEKELDAINEQRIRVTVEAGESPEEALLLDYEDKYEEYWEVQYLTPFGKCLYKGDSPYLHQSHPYTLMLFPMLDGEVWGKVEDIIDQQRYINRLISLIDAIMGSSAKGVLLVPEEAIPADMTIDDFADEWSKFNGVIKIKAKAGAQLPQQVSANASNVGAHELLAIQMKLIENIVGVSGAIQGQSAKSGTPSSLYAQEAQNSTINSKDVFDSYLSFKKNRDHKILSLIIQNYTTTRPILSDKRGEDVMYFEPEMVKDIEYDFVITQGSDTPVYRQLLDDTLWKLLEGQMIDIEMYLENSTLPYADKLLQSIQAKRQQMSENPQVTPEMMGEISGMSNNAQSQADPKAMALLSQMAGGQA